MAVPVTRVLRRPAAAAACIGALAVSAGALVLADHSAAAGSTRVPGLSTHSATSHVPDSAGQLVATAYCSPGEHVVSGGFKSSSGAYAVASHALRSANGWIVRLYSPTKLTTYAYCARYVRLSTHKGVFAAAPPPADTNAGAHCPRRTIVSGGYALLGPQSQQSNSPTVQDSRSHPPFTPKKRRNWYWTVTTAVQHTPAKLAAFAYCLPRVAIDVRSSSSPLISDGGDGSASASCRNGETLLAGGYTTAPAPNFVTHVGPELFYGASYRSGRRSWTASAHNGGSQAAKIRTFVYCQPGPQQAP